MNTSDSSEIQLHQFVSSQDDEVFRELVRQQSGMVLATATRQLRGDRSMAEDVAQEVFNLLVKKAASLDGHVNVGGWLYRQTCRLASNYLRSELRRRTRETTALNLMNAKPDSMNREVVEELDAALLTLPTPSRDLVVMRFFEGRNYQNVAQHYGISEDAARKRVSRALEMLRAALGRRGQMASVSVLTTILFGVGNTPVEAALITRMASSALQVPIAKVSFLSGGAMLLGAFSVSVLASGMKLASGKYSPEENPEVRQEEDSKLRVSQNRLPAYLRTPAGDATHEDIIAQIIEIYRGPQHKLSQLKVRTLMELISDSEITHFVDASKNRFTDDACSACYGQLLQRWAKREPDAALTYALKVEIEKIVSMSSEGVLFELMKPWADRDPLAAAQWLERTWGNKKHDGRGYSQVDSHWGVYGDRLYRKDFLVRLVIQSLENSKGLPEVIEYVRSFDETTQFRMLRALAVIESQDLATIADYLHSQANTQDVRRIKSFFWARWDQPGNQSLSEENEKEVAELLKQLSPEKRFDARLAMIAQGRDVIPLYEEGRMLGFSEREVIEEIAKSYLAAPWFFKKYQAMSDIELSDWLRANASDLDLENAIRHRLDRWIERDPVMGEISQVVLALHLRDQNKGRKIARKAFRQFAEKFPLHVPAYLKRMTLPEDLRSEFEKLSQGAK